MCAMKTLVKCLLLLVAVVHRVSGEPMVTIYITGDTNIIGCQQNVPPRWIVEPSDNSFALGSDAKLECKADGFPKPSISWKKAAGRTPGDYHDLDRNNPNVRVTEDGTLEIKNMQKSHEGYFLCEASNGIGAELSTVIYVTVQGEATSTDSTITAITENTHDHDNGYYKQPTENPYLNTQNREYEVVEAGKAWEFSVCGWSSYPDTYDPYKTQTLEECMEGCNENRFSGCTAITYRSSDNICTLRDCPVPAPEPTESKPGFIAYALKVHEAEGHDAPDVFLQLGGPLHGMDPKEGDDIFFECKIRSNPVHQQVTWSHNGKLLRQNVNSGIVISGNSMAIRNLKRKHSGAYRCTATNSVGTTVSEPWYLTLRPTDFESQKPTTESPNSNAVTRAAVEFKIKDLRVPEPAVAGRSARLECNWSAETIFYIRWYKDDELFFTIKPNMNIKTAEIDVYGVTVDVDASNEYTVVLRDVSAATAGEYKCEVMGEKPWFETKHLTKILTVAEVPAGVELTGLEPSYNVGDLLNVTCIVRNARPAARISFFVDDNEVTVQSLSGHMRLSAPQYGDRENTYTTQASLNMRLNRQHVPRTRLHCVGRVSSLPPIEAFRMILVNEAQPSDANQRRECPDGTFGLESSNQCFKVLHRLTAAWSTASGLCDSINGLGLAEPESDIAVELQKYLNDNYGDSNYWLNAEGRQHVYWKRSGERVGPTSLLHDGGRWWKERYANCLVLHADDRHLRDEPGRPYDVYNCSPERNSRSHKILCEVTDFESYQPPTEFPTSNGLTPDSCSGPSWNTEEGFIKASGSDQCFRFYNEPYRTWEDAKAWCASQGMALAVPEEDIVWDIIDATKGIMCSGYGCPLTPVWLGARGTGDSMEWVQEDTEVGDPRDSNLWARGQGPWVLGSKYCLGVAHYEGPGPYGRPYIAVECSDEAPTLCEVLSG